ncbi:MAG TPA: hypothetical protein VM452_08520 [Caulifigura sp.]|nr:hypothetical protein [Caulifigura sp.]
MRSTWKCGLLAHCVAVLGLTLALCPPSRAADPPTPPAIAAIYEMQVEPSKFKKLFDLPAGHRCGSPRVSPDGKQLAFDGWKPGDGQNSSSAKVFMCNLDGSEMRELCSGAMPTFSPDGKRFACSRYGEPRGVWVMDGDGGGECLDENGWGIQWAPDGDTVAYVRGNNIVVHDLDSNEKRELFSGGSSPFSSIMWNMSWSADGRKIAMVATTPGGGVNKELAIVDVQGAEHGFKRFASGNLVPSVTWNGEGRKIVLPDRVGKDYRMLEIDPEKEEALRVVPGIPVDSRAQSASWLPDGSRLIVLCNFN